ncbi:MAG: hypothetical protein LBC86_07560 [Oscillospiraceae bacterium]|jgi:hypothetical protein|nr:hypothetical protein [Oscillospiraceae bacterium]
MKGTTTMKIKKIITLLLTIIMTATLLAGCGGTLSVSDGVYSGTFEYEDTDVGEIITINVIITVSDGGTVITDMFVEMSRVFADKSRGDLVHKEALSSEDINVQIEDQSFKIDFGEYLLLEGNLVADDTFKVTGNFEYLQNNVSNSKSTAFSNAEITLTRN